MIECPNGWHPNADQLDDVELTGSKMKVTVNLMGDERTWVTCHCGYPRLGRLVDVVFADDHVTCVSGRFVADDPWEWEIDWGEYEA